MLQLRSNTLLIDKFRKKWKSILIWIVKLAYHVPLSKGLSTNESRVLKDYLGQHKSTTIIY